MTTKYKVGTYDNTIFAVEVVKETRDSVWLKNGLVEGKVSGSKTIYDTWDQAHAQLLERAMIKRHKAQVQILKLSAEIEEIKRMKP